MTARTYLKHFFAFALSGLALIALVGLGVDGFGVFGTRLIAESHFPSNLRLSVSGDRVTKAIEIAERHGDTILFLGDSRAQHGLDPDAPTLAGTTAYNAALAAASLREQIMVLDYALSHEPAIKHVVWGLSLEEFPFAIATSGDYADSGFAHRSIVSGFLRHLFAVDWAGASLKALMEAPRHVRASMKRNGVAAVDGDPVEGPAIAARFEGELAGTARELHGDLSQSALDEAQAMFVPKLAKLKAAGIDVDLVIEPMHVWRLEFFRLVGIEAQHETWKRGLAQTVETLASEPGAGKIRLFDFAKPHPFTEQSVFDPPLKGERRYFLESSHFYPWLGDKILAKLLPRRGLRETSSFGTEIVPGSIDEDIASAKSDLDQWEASHPRDVGYVRELIPKR
ncbi:MAG: hypothetical protein JOY67_00870 [Hyphomicrobiales bacterium]|nr:hypothetical protein [Hyphomicrobiales bacterium]